MKIEICKDYPKEYWCGNPENKVSTPDEILINSKGERVKCIYCGKDIHISKFGGINKKGLFCNESFCLLELIKENESGN